MDLLKKLFKKLNGRKSITYDELNNLLPKGYLLEEHIEEILSFLAEHNITLSNNITVNSIGWKKYENDILMDNLINTPDKFYFYELSKNKKLKMESEKVLLQELSHIKEKIIELLIETEFFQFQLFKDIVKTKPIKNINFIFFISQEAVSIVTEKTKNLFKKYSSDKHIWSNKIEFLSYLQKLDFKFTYILEKIEYLKNIEKKIHDNEKEQTKNSISIKRNKVDDHLLKHIFPELNYLLKQYNAVKQKLIKNQLPLVLSITKHYFRKNITYNDIIQEGNIALIEALDLYNKTYHKKEFNQFISSRIRERVKNFIGRNNSMITVSDSFRKECKFFLKTFKELRDRLMKNPSLKEVKTKLGWNDKKVLKVINYLKEEESLEREDDTLKLNLKNAIMDKARKLPEDIAIDNILKEQIVGLLEQLDDNEKVIIKLRFGFNPENVSYDYRDIAQHLHLAENEVKTIEEIALKKLRIIFKMNNMEEFI
ncbi:MAG: sigma-70 family RNA polymerase sigma factor [Spirochaetes bacterium]|nr:sigma-70 family RNA polymerase sigma factor [Spirochaetota bacterium]